MHITINITTNCLRSHFGSNHFGLADPMPLTQSLPPTGCVSDASDTDDGDGQEVTTEVTMHEHGPEHTLQDWYMP